MSGDLVWMCIRDNNSYLKKRNGVQLSAEPGNLLGRHSQRHSGLAQKKTVGLITKNKSSLILTTKKTNADKRRPNKSLNRITLSKGMGRIIKAVNSTTKQYRPDLKNAALARATALLRVRRKVNSGIRTPKKRGTRHPRKQLRSKTFRKVNRRK